MFNNYSNELVNTLYSSIDEGRAGKHIGTSTGLAKLDKQIGGIQKRTYYLISGLSGAGKTSFALYSFIYKPLCAHLNDDNYVVIYFSLEMSCNKLLAKLLSLHLWDEYHINVSYKKLMSWIEPLNDQIYQYVQKSKEWLEKISKHLIIYDKALNRTNFYHIMMNFFNEHGSWEEVGSRKVYIPENPELTVVGVIDHISLVTPSKGVTKKDEIDAVSNYAVSLRERCGASFVVLQQENRNSSNMDRRKLDMTETSLEDLKDSGVPANDCEIAIGVYFPLKHKLKTCHHYPIILDEDSEGWPGLRDFYRGLVKL